MSGDLRETIFERMLLIRRFEERLLELFEQGVLNGTTHTCIGQEHIAATFAAGLDPARDVFFASHRCHGHFIAFTDDPYRLACEIMGRVDGVNRGLGGSQHIHRGGFFSNGVQGGIVANACGMGLAKKLGSGDGIVTVTLGDGTFGEGIVYESLNLASLWELPVLFLVEDNGYAQSTPRERNTSGDFVRRFEAFEVPVVETDSLDPLDLASIFAETVEEVRRFRSPRAVVVHAFRIASHSKSDDGRDPKLVEELRRRDPLGLCRGAMEESRAQEVERRVEDRLREVFDRALQCPLTTEL